MTAAEFQVPIEEVARYMLNGGRSLEGRLLARVKRLLAEAPVDPKGVWCVDGDRICLAGTIGGAFDRWQRRLGLLSAVDALVSQAIGAAAVELVMDEVEAEAKAALGGSWGARRSPGYGEMPLSASREILAKLDASRRIGIVCTADHLLLPSKSVTAICLKT